MTGWLIILGAFAGSLVNWATYELAWDRRWISPWSRVPPDVAPRRWFDCLPIIGWWRLRREFKHHGRGFWIRPMFLEIFTGVAFGWYFTQAADGLLYPDWLPVASTAAVHAQIIGHLTLFCFLLACTTIDLDEQTIPDELTVPGTLAALIYVSLVPSALLPNVEFTGAQAPLATSLWLVEPSRLWPSLRAGTITGLLCATFAWAAWTFALLHKTCTLRHGWNKAVRYMIVSIFRRRSWLWMGPTFVVGAAVIGFNWWRGGDYWLATLTSLGGMIFGGGMVWIVRAAGTWALRQEAMGFGDVTLMAMLGALLGWQATIIIFFLAPVAALIIAVAQLFYNGRHALAFGPYLALATVLLVVGWSQIWFHDVRHYFELGWLLPSITLVSVVGMGLLLWIWRTVRDALWHVSARAGETAS